MTYQWQQVEQLKPGKGPTPVFGDVVNVRCKGSFNVVVFDNQFESKEPYLHRVGSGSVSTVS